MTTILAFALKRSVMARLQAINTGSIPPPAGAEMLASSGVQVNPILPAEPDRICVYGTPVRSTRQITTAERTTCTESVACEIRIRVYQPGEADEDVGDVDLLTSQLCNAVAKAVIDGDPLVDRSLGDLYLYEVLQWPTAVTPHPEPSVTGLASLVFQAELMTN